MSQRIYVVLVGDGTDVWVPVNAVQLGSDIYQISETNVRPADMEWEFEVRSIVKCRPHTTPEGEKILVAYEAQARNEVKG